MRLRHSHGAVEARYSFSRKICKENATIWYDLLNWNTHTKKTMATHYSLYQCKIISDKEKALKQNIKKKFLSLYSAF
jgi:hypothetical protein